MTRKEAKSCIGTIEMLQRLAYNIHGVMDVIDADNCEKIIKALEQEPVLDKIRSEIAEYGSIWVEYKITGRRDKDIEQLVSDVLSQAKKQVLEVIDKYKEDNNEKAFEKNEHLG